MAVLEGLVEEFAALSDVVLAVPEDPVADVVDSGFPVEGVPFALVPFGPVPVPPPVV